MYKLKKNKYPERTFEKGFSNLAEDLFKNTSLHIIYTKFVLVFGQFKFIYDKYCDVKIVFMFNARGFD